MTVGKRLKTARKAAGYTQESLEEAAGVPQATISRIERDETDDPGVLIMAKIASALGVPIERLVSDDTLPQDRLAAAETKATAATATALRNEVNLAVEIQELRDRVERLEHRPQRRQAEG